MTRRPVLIVEDEPALAAALASACGRLGLAPLTAYSGARALEILSREPVALVVLDIGLPDMNGLALLEHVRGSAGPPPVLVITAHGNLENALAAKRLGATEYLVKPLDLAQLQDTVRQLLRPAVPPATAVPLPPVDEEDSAALLIGGAAAMQPVFRAIAHACATEAPVLITGPTGTGKTLVGRVIHQNSARRGGPFVSLHCSALPEPLLESELFGHEKNAFTGAGVDRPGHLERAGGGTLLLDEIGELSPAVQTKLLRVVEERTFNRVGGRVDLTVDLRLITATSRDLRAEVRAGRFREDLYYRLHVLEVELPALAQRAADIPALAAFFLGRRAPAPERRLSDDALRLLQQYPWPGNVRELRNAIAHAVAVGSGDTVLPQHLPREIRLHDPHAGAERLATALAPWLQERLAAGATYDDLQAELEGTVLRHLLAHFDHKPTRLARVLQMNRATLLKKRRGLGISGGKGTAPPRP